MKSSETSSWKFAKCSALALLMTVPSSLAYSQSFDPGTTYNPNNTEADTFDRGENVSVRQRPRPEYEAEGIHAGGFMVYPKMSLGVGYDSNIYATHTDKVNDTIFNISPEVDFQSTWSRNALAGYARLSQDIFASHSTENTTQYGAGLNGKYEFGESNLTGGFDYGRYALPRSAANNGLLSKHPIVYDYTATNTQLTHTFNRLRLSLRADYQTYNYQNGETFAGVQVFEKDQDRNVTTITGKAEYAVSPDSAVFAVAAHNTRDYSLSPPTVAYTRDSNGYDVGGGFNFDVTHLIRGEAQLGYMDQQYKSLLFKDIKGLSAKAQFEWFPTPLSTVTGTMLRTVGDSGIIGSAGYVTTAAGLRVDHELLRNLILTATTSAGQDKYSGIDRTDNHWGAGASANYLVNRHIGVQVGYTYTNERSSGFARGPTFDDHRLMLSTVFQF